MQIINLSKLCRSEMRMQRQWQNKSLYSLVILGFLQCSTPEVTQAAFLRKHKVGGKCLITKTSKVTQSLGSKCIKNLYVTISRTTFIFLQSNLCFFFLVYSVHINMHPSQRRGPIYLTLIMVFSICIYLRVLFLLTSTIYLRQIQS